MTVKEYIIQLFNSGIDVVKIKITNMLNFHDPSFEITKEDGTIATILVEIYTCSDPEVVEFYDSNDILCAKAKGFVSVL